ncbi:MAG: hypothetical protein L0Z53_12460 [Acidobacteriales bacterium]|nr:hypothetical protein [Terriglobales bacterium]
MLRRAASLVAVVALYSLSAISQAPDLNPQSNDERPPTPTVIFKLDWPGAEPEYYALTIDSTGRAAYESRGGSKFQSGDPHSFRFTASDGARDRVFEAARKLNYFNGNFDYRKGKIAFTGTKTLTYADPTRHFETTYNWSENPTLRQLTDLMQGISVTLEFGRSLDYLYRHDKLGLNAELKRMDEMAADGHLAELQALGPQLERIASDSNVMEIARQKARRLLQRASAANRSAESQATAQR